MKIFSKTPKAFVLPVALLCSSVWADVSYINESGEVAYVKDGGYTVLTNESAIGNLTPGGWYVVQGNLSFGYKMYCSGDINLILADGASLTITNNDINSGGDVYIYGQTKQSGRLIVYGPEQGIYARSITIAGGIVDISAPKEGLYATEAGGINIVNGLVSAFGGNHQAFYTPAGTTNISGDKRFLCQNGSSTTIYSSTDLLANINTCKTIKSYNPPIKVNGTSITIDGDYNGLNTIEESLLDIDFGGETSRTFDNVTFNRTFPLVKYSTFMLPFEVDKSQLGGVGTLLRYNGITKDNGKVTIQMSRSVGERLSAYTPYMVLMDDPTLTVQGPVTLSKNVSVTPVSSDECIANSSGMYCEWKMYGSQAYKKWTADDLTRVTVYGFAAEEKSEKIYIGKFVKAGAGAWIRAFRGFLANGDGSTPSAQGRARYNKPVMSSIEQPELPAEIDIVIVEDDEQTTVIGKMNTRTGEIMMNRDFDLKGRRVGNNKAAHGAYYGKKVLKK